MSQLITNSARRLGKSNRAPFQLSSALNLHLNPLSRPYHTPSVNAASDTTYPPGGVYTPGQVSIRRLARRRCWAIVAGVVLADGRTDERHGGGSLPNMAGHGIIRPGRVRTTDDGVVRGRKTGKAKDRHDDVHRRTLLSMTAHAR